jgi:hypothetical protein
MQKLGGWLVILLVVSLPVWYGVHLILNYVHIESQLKKSEARIIHPRIDDDAKSEIGYIYAMRNETQIRDNRLNLVWFVVVPATNVHYSGVYDSGYGDWKVGDSIHLIHNKDDSEADYGYLVGMHDQKQGKSTFVWIINSDDAMEDGSIMDDNR